MMPRIQVPQDKAIVTGSRCATHSEEFYLNVVQSVYVNLQDGFRFSHANLTGHLFQIRMPSESQTSCGGHIQTPGKP